MSTKPNRYFPLSRASPEEQPKSCRKPCRVPNESMKRLSRYVLLIAVVLLVDSIGMAAGAQTGNFAGLIDIGGDRKMYLKCRGKGSPTVVLVSGLRASADDWDISDKSQRFSLELESSRACVPAIALERRSVKSQAAATPFRSRLQRRTQLQICTPC